MNTPGKILLMIFVGVRFRFQCIGVSTKTKLSA